MNKLKQGEAVLSLVTMGELIFGAMKSSQKDLILHGLTELEVLMPVLPLDRAVADEYGVIRAQLETSGTPIGNNDLWIAAHAKALGLTLVTNNEKEFKRIKGLKVENWAK
ncbi:MAG TPA: PIN domain-containing protein [Candidatus Acidoferrum sp.]|nr:PIN domain-containing protein [Candidatus Acidoferrum sp.]